MKYDAIIVGASFAGLAVASRLRGNILLIDKKGIGTGQTSACGTHLSVLDGMNCLDSVLQVYNIGFIHTSSKTIEYKLPYPFCSFDYQKFCQIVVKRVEAKIIKANVRGLMDGCVMTDEGPFHGTCIIDASGWKAVLASSLERDFVDRSKLSFGIETTVNYEGEGLQFWLDPRLIKGGVGWLFPCGSQARFGVGSYLGETNLGPRLASFLSNFHLQSADVHGGFLPSGLRRPTVGRLFLVADAAGQCEPFTGFGIKPALYFGMKCADTVQRVIDKEISLEEGLQHYNELVRTYHRYYTFLEGLQKLYLTLPNSWLTRLLKLISYQPVFNFILEWHQRHAVLESVLKRDAPWETRYTFAGAGRSRQTDKRHTAVVHCKGGGNQNR
jgi:flavin-dependent dehydrogenase